MAASELQSFIEDLTTALADPLPTYRPLADDIDDVVASSCLEVVRRGLIDKMRKGLVLDPLHEDRLFGEVSRLLSIAVRRTDASLLLAALGAMFIADRELGAYAFPGNLSLVLDAAKRIGVDPPEVVNSALQSTNDSGLHRHVRHFLDELPPPRQRAEANDWLAVGGDQEFRYVRMTYAANHLGLVEEVSRARRAAQ